MFSRKTQSLLRLLCTYRRSITTTFVIDGNKSDKATNFFEDDVRRELMKMDEYIGSSQHGEVVILGMDSKSGDW